MRAFAGSTFARILSLVHRTVPPEIHLMEAVLRHLLPTHRDEATASLFRGPNTQRQVQVVLLSLLSSLESMEDGQINWQIWYAIFTFKNILTLRIFSQSSLAPASACDLIIIQRLIRDLLPSKCCLSFSFRVHGIAHSHEPTVCTQRSMRKMNHLGSDGIFFRPGCCIKVLVVERSWFGYFQAKLWTHAETLHKIYQTYDWEVWRAFVIGQSGTYSPRGTKDGRWIYGHRSSDQNGSQNRIHWTRLNDQ